MRAGKLVLNGLVFAAAAWMFVHGTEQGASGLLPAHARSPISTDPGLAALEERAALAPNVDTVVKLATAYLEREQPTGALLGPAHTIQEDPARAAAHRTFDLGCKLELKEADGAVCLEGLAFDLVPHPGYNAFALEARSL